MRIIPWLLAAVLSVGAAFGQGTPITPPFSGGIVPGQVGSNSSLRVTVAPASDWTIGTKAGVQTYPVLMFQPGPLATPISNFAVDIMPVGGNPTDNAGSGNVWADLCNQDLNNIAAATSCAHYGATHAGDAIFGNSQYNGQPRGNIFLPTNTQSPFSEQTVIDAQDQIFSRGMLVQGGGSSVGAAANVEDVGSNILVQSISLTPGSFTYTNASFAGTASESPNGGTNAAVITSTQVGGNAAQTTGSVADTSAYTFSIYVSSASASPLAQLNAAFNTGGVTINSGVTIVPSTGALVQVGSAPIAYGAQKIIAGCQTLCAGQATVWWRVWLTVANSNNSVVSLIFYPSGFSGATNSAIAYGAQLEHSATLGSYVPTPGTTAVTRPIGTPILPLNAASMMNYGQSSVRNVVKTTPATGATVTFAASQQEALIVPAGTLATLTVTLPACAAANDGDERKFIVSQAITALTVGASSGSVVGGATAASAGGGHSYHCYGADTAWYQMQ